MPERILDRVPPEFQLKPDSQILRQELLEADPSLASDRLLLEEAHGLIVYNNFVAGIYTSPERLKVRDMNKVQAEANTADIDCVDGRRGGKQQEEGPTHTEPGGFTKRAPRLYQRKKHESGGKHIPRSAFLRGGIKAAAYEGKDLVEFPKGHFMEEPLKDANGKHLSPFQTCGQAAKMQDQGEIKDPDLIRGHIGKLNEITVQAVTDWYDDCLDMQGRDILKMVCVPLMLDAETRGYVLDLDKKNLYSPLSVAELIKVYRGRIEASLGKLVGSYGSKAEWLLNPAKITDLALVRYEITRGLMQDDQLRPFREDILTYLSEHYADLNAQQRQGVLFKFSNNGSLVYLQGSAYKEAEHPYKWHNERCLVISPEGNPPFVYFPDIQSFVATPPEQERTNIYANTMIDIWNHYHEEAKTRNSHTRMPDEILIFLTTPVYGELTQRHHNYVAALNTSAELFHHMISDPTKIESENGATKFDLYKAGKLKVFSLLYDYQTRIIRAVVNNRAIANR